MARVDAAHVQRRVGLQIAKLAGLFEDGVIGQARALHPGQDVVAGAVHHAHHAGDAVAGHALGHRLDHRDAARDGGLEPDHAAQILGQLGQVLTVHGQKRLVRGHDILAGPQCSLDAVARDARIPADQFDENINVIGGGDRHRVRLPPIGRQVRVAVLHAVACADGGDRHRATRPHRQQVGVFLNDLDDTDPDGAKPGDAEAEGGRHECLSSLILRVLARRSACCNARCGRGAVLWHACRRTDHGSAPAHSPSIPVRRITDTTWRAACRVRSRTCRTSSAPMS